MVFCLNVDWPLIPLLRQRQRLLQPKVDTLFVSDRDQPTPSVRAPSEVPRAINHRFVDGHRAGRLAGRQVVHATVTARQCIASVCSLAFISAQIAQRTTSFSECATVTEPCPRINVNRLPMTPPAPGVERGVLHQHVVIVAGGVADPNTGVENPRNPLMWQTGRRVARVTPNGMMAGEWRRTIAITSGRALYISPDEASR